MAFDRNTNSESTSVDIIFGLANRATFSLLQQHRLQQRCSSAFAKQRSTLNCKPISRHKDINELSSIRWPTTSSQIVATADHQRRWLSRRSSRAKEGTPRQRQKILQNCKPDDSSLRTRFPTGQVRDHIKIPLTCPSHQRKVGASGLAVVASRRPGVLAICMCPCPSALGGDPSCSLHLTYI